MITQDFYGKKGFIWWTGVVEDRDDPLKLGSVRVRIIGLHSNDKVLIPTSSLPWAQVLQAPTGASTTSGPREGDWVFGFFQDGDYAQIPVIIGVFPGIESSQSQTIFNEVKIKKGPTKTPIPSQVDRVLGEPTTSRMSRGQMEGTLTNSLNQRLSHACDVKVPIEIAVAWARLQNGTLMTALTAAIKSIAASLGSDPSGLVSTAINILKKLQSYLRWIQSILQEIQDWAKVIIRYAQIAKAIIDFINSLPDKIRRFLSNCIAKIISGIMSVIGALFATDGLPSFEVGELFTEFNNTLTELGKTGKEVLQTAALPGQFVEALINPSSQQDQSKAEKILGGVISSVKDNGTAINNQVQYKRENGVP